jgi:lysyl-tRNA synthetase class 1
MAIQPPPEVTAVLDKFDAREDTFEVIEVMGEVEKAVTDPKSLSPETKRGWWAECAAFAFDTHKAPDGGPWKTYFQPMMTVGQGESMRCKPDLRQADAEVVVYWGERAKAVKHPVLAARYADLVWDTTKFVTKSNPGIEFARLAIDNYLAASRLDDGTAWSNTRRNLGAPSNLP